MLKRVLTRPSFLEDPPPRGSIVQVHYRGRLATAADDWSDAFDDSYARGKPLKFSLGEPIVIAGWMDALVTMVAGEKAEVTIAPEKAYGSRGKGDAIPPGATLVFEMELVSFASPQEGGIAPDDSSFTPEQGCGEAAALPTTRTLVDVSDGSGLEGDSASRAMPPGEPRLQILSLSVVVVSLSVVVAL